MNIFVLDKDPILAARDHCDRHVIKMILESAQMLSTAHWSSWRRILNPPPLKGQKLMQEWLASNVPVEHRPAWKMTHVNHPCTQWAGLSWGNYRWLSLHGQELCREYTRRYGREHSSHSIHRWLYSHVPPHFEHMSVTPLDITPFALAMPDDCKVAGDAVQSYRNYYINHKKRMAKWAHSKTPAWWPEEGK
jgi:hypothetical protein